MSQVKLFPLLPGVMSMFKSEMRLEASEKTLAIHSFPLDKTKLLFP